MQPRTSLAVAVAVALLATAGGVALAIRSGGYAPARTATGRVTIYSTAADSTAAAPAQSGRTDILPAGTFPARYCGSYGNVATQRGYTYLVDLPGGRTLMLSDSVGREPGAQDPARVALGVTGPGGAYTWGPGRGGTVTLGPELLTAEVDVRLVGPRGDTVPLRASFTCQPRVKAMRRG